MAKNVDDIVVIISELIGDYPYGRRGYADPSKDEFVVDMDLASAVLAELERQGEVMSHPLNNLVYTLIRHQRP